MLWFVLSLCLAFLMATKFVYVKYVLRNTPVYVVALASFLFSFPLLVVLLMYVGIPKVTPTFWIMLVIGGTLHAIGSTLTVKGLELSDVSLTMPLLSFTPVFMLVTSPIMIGEFPSKLGILGILLIVCGAYAINISKTHEGVLAPFRALWKNKGSRYVLFASFLFSIVANIDRIGINHSSVFLWGAAVSGYISILIILFIWKIDAPELRKLSHPSLWLIGLLYALIVTFHLIAIQFTLVAYVIAIKRISILIGIVLAYILFKEKNFMERFSGAILMVLGVVIIAFS